MRIGILVEGIEELNIWEIRLIELLRSELHLDILLLIKNGIKDSNKLEKNNISGLFKDLNKRVLLFQENFEKTRYKLLNKPVIKDNLVDDLGTLRKMTLKNDISNGICNTDPLDLALVKNYDLDVILMLGNNKVCHEIIECAKFGVWTLNFSDYSGTDSSIAGFWEVLNEKPYITVLLLKIEGSINEGHIIDKAYFNRHISSFAKTKDLILKSSVSLVIKNLKKINKIGEKSLYSDTVSLKSQFDYPGFTSILKYFLKYYRHLISGFFQAQLNSVGRRFKCWTLFISSGDFLNSDITAIIPIKLPKDEYWADPFLFRYLDVTYVFFENYSYLTKKGKISCGILKNNEIIDVIDVFDAQYHLSYPFIFEENGDIYLMPETSGNNRLEIYRSIKFPNLWELYSTAFEGERVVDASIFKDDNSQNWLFVNKESIPGTGCSNELYIYKFNSLKLDDLEAHRENPVFIDSRVARNGGAIFKYRNEYYRPSQSSTDGVYGRALSINRIEKLSITEYSEKTIRKIEPSSIDGMISLHHLHQIDNLFVFDSAYKKI